MTIVKLMGIPFFKGRHNILRILVTIDMNLLIGKRHDILIQYHGNYTKVKIINFMLDIDILKIRLKKSGCPKG